MRKYSQQQVTVMRLIRWVTSRIKRGYTSHNHAQVVAAISAIQPNLTANSYTAIGIKRHIRSNLSHYMAILQSISDRHYPKYKTQLANIIHQATNYVH